MKGKEDWYDHSPSGISRAVNTKIYFYIRQDAKGKDDTTLSTQNILKTGMLQELIKISNTYTQTPTRPKQNKNQSIPSRFPG